MSQRLHIAAPQPAAAALAEQAQLAGFACVASPAEADLLLIDADHAMIQNSGLPALYLYSNAAAACQPALQKPVVLKELVAALKRLSPPARKLGEWGFDAASRALTHADGRTLTLTEKESALLAALLAAPASSRETLLAEVWGYGAEVDTHTLETHLYRLRARLKDVLTDAQWTALTPDKVAV